MKPDIEEILEAADETQDRDAYGAFEENDVDTPEEAEEQLAEAEAGESTMGEAEVEVAELADGIDTTSGLPSEPPVEGDLDEEETVPPTGGAK